MSIQFKARFVDLANLVVAKGSNFAITALVFAIVSRRTDAQGFAQFGYWWSVAVMIGGMALGGTSSALIRATAVEGSLAHLAPLIRRTVLPLAAAVAAWCVARIALPRFASTLVLIAAAAAFGITIQVQTAVLGLLRAIQASRANLVASLLVVAIVPATFAMVAGRHATVTTQYVVLIGAYALGTVAGVAVAWRPLEPLLTRAPRGGSGARAFLANVASFSAINAFSYATLNIDFTLFKLMGGPDEFTTVAACKIFFDRFALPALLVFAGAISLSVLRHSGPTSGDASKPKLELMLTRKAIGVAVAVAISMVVGYYAFVGLRSDAHPVPLPWLLCVALGYLAYVMSAILMDVLVIRRGLRAVVVHVAAFVATGFAVQWLAIRFLGIAGWALGWLALNLTVLTVLAREGLAIQRAGPRPRGEESRPSDIVEAG